MTAGLIVFFRDTRQGHNSIKIAGMEFSLSAPSLVIFVVGALLLVFPFTSFRRHDPPSTEESAPVSPASFKFPSLTGTGWNIRVHYCGVPPSHIFALKEAFQKTPGVEQVSLFRKDWQPYPKSDIMFFSPPNEAAALEIAGVIEEGLHIKLDDVLARSEDPNLDGRLFELHLYGKACPSSPSY